MKKMLTTTALTLALALSAGVSAASAKGPKHTPEHAAAIKKCNADYKAALKEAKTKKGADRRTAEQAARAARKQCVAAAPK
jgi:hypothetical protein